MAQHFSRKVTGSKRFVVRWCLWRGLRVISCVRIVWRYRSCKRLMSASMASEPADDGVDSRWELVSQVCS